MAGNRRHPLYAVGIIERHDNTILIVRPGDRGGVRSAWQFPFGIARDHESPEAAMRRVAHECLGLEIEIVVGQPPLLQTIEGKSAELRYFFCGIQQGGPDGKAFAEVRWINRGHLLEYEFDQAFRPVVDWLLESRK